MQWAYMGNLISSGVGVVLGKTSLNWWQVRVERLKARDFLHRQGLTEILSFPSLTLTLSEIGISQISGGFFINFSTNVCYCLPFILVWHN